MILHAIKHSFSQLRQRALVPNCISATPRSLHSGKDEALGSAVRPLTLNKVHGIHANADEGCIAAARLLDSGSRVLLSWSDGRQSEYSALYLRHHDRSPAAISSETGEPIDSRQHIRPDIERFQSIAIERHAPYGDCLAFHVSEPLPQEQGFVPASLLLDAERLRRVRKEDERIVPATTIRQLQFAQFAQDSSAFRYELYRALVRDGCCSVRGVPIDGRFMQGEFIPIVMQTRAQFSPWSGYAFELPSKGSSSDDGRPLTHHMDEPIIEGYAGLTLLHCLAADNGAVTLLADVLAIAERFRTTHPAYFRLLSEQAAIVHEYVGARPQPEGAQHYRRLTPILQLNDRQHVVKAQTSRYFQGPLMLDGPELRQYFLAYQCFDAMLRREEWQLKHEMRAGDVLLFNNRRMAHGRERQKRCGRRRVQGHFVSVDDFRSRAVVVHQERGEFITPRVGNGDWL